MMNLQELCRRLRQRFPSLLLLEAEPMAKHTSFQIGGCAAMAFPDSVQELAELYRFCLQAQHPPLILGAGSNVLAPDEGLDHLVICTKQVNRITLADDTTIVAECGATMTRLAVFARDLGLTGLEFAHGIPGTVGGGTYMNAGAYGGEIRQVAVRTTAVLPDGTLWEAEGEAQDFSYRHSAFEENGSLILETVFSLRKGEPAVIGETMKELAQKRRNSQPLEWPSAGSTFKRPVGGYAAALIDQAGLKGKGVGDAVVSEKHAGFVINRGNATAADVLAAMELIRQVVYDRSGILLEPEVRIW